MAQTTMMLGTTPQTNNTTSSDNGQHVNTNHRNNWGWFEDDHHSEESDSKTDTEKRNAGLFKSFPKLIEEEVTPVNDDEEYKASAVTAPVYVLEESRSSQHLWKCTAGHRPPQPVEEREFFEQLWAINFAQSNVNYGLSVETLQRSAPMALSPFADGDGADDYGGAKIFDGDDSLTVKGIEANASVGVGLDQTEHDRDGDGAGLHRSFGPHFHKHTPVNKKIESEDQDVNGALTVLVKGDNVFGTTVSKSFTKFDPNGGGRPENVSVSASIGSYRVVESKTKGKYAQFLVIYCEGNFRETLGVWKRHSDFKNLSVKVAAGQDACACSPLAIAEEDDDEVLPNAMTSWRLLQKRQRWYRCLDAGYLSLKSFLLERFLHDILFESSTPKMLRDFVCADHATAVSQSNNAYT